MTMPAESPFAAELEAGRPFGVPAAAVERIDTTAAHVFLVGERAYKLKRPVRFSFLDFTTVDGRHAALVRELELNRRTAPDLYLSLKKLVRDTDGLRLGAVDDPAAALDWLLEMVRFPKAAELDRIAATGPLAADLATALGVAVAAMHQTAPVHPEAGGATAMADVIAGNREDLAAAPPGVFDDRVVARIDAAARAALTRLGPLLDRRRAAGFVRHCHGDLHLGNLVALDGRVVPFDCIEFDDDFARIDVAYDLAFLLMDLVHRDDAAAARTVLQVDLERTDDLAGLAALPFFMAIRATIRAKVEALALTDRTDAAAVAAARSYLHLAAELEPAPPPRLIGIGGLSGSGKTTLALALAPLLRPQPGALVWRSDLIRKAQAGVEPTHRLGADAYTPAANAAVFAELRDRAARCVDAGWSVIVDAVHRQPEEREALAALAGEWGVPFSGLWLDAAPDALVARIEARSGDASDADAAVVRAQLDAAPGPIAWQRIAADRDAAAVLRAALTALDMGAGET